MATSYSLQLAILYFLGFALTACVTSTPREDQVSAEISISPTAHNQEETEVALAFPSENKQEIQTSEQPQQIIDLLTDASLMEVFEAQGLSFGEIIATRKINSLAELKQHPGFHSFYQVIAQDLQRDAIADPRAGVGMKYAHRQLDSTWLQSTQTRMELIAIVNRLDRHPFAREHCGETRLIYRLAYTSKSHLIPIHSRLPMTINVVFWQEQPSQNCQQAARRWQIPQGRSGAELVTSLRSTNGPLAPQRLALSQLKSLEVNFQSVRWPSVVHPSLGGHAEYILRVFQLQGEQFVPAPLENTPDVERLRKNPKLRKELLEWLLNPKHTALLDQGIPVIPEPFLAKRAVSVAPRGFARKANRLFSQLFSTREIADIQLQSDSHIRSPQALLRRLDGLTCNGCHETRSIAGFHLLGEERKQQDGLDALAVAISPHLSGELPRRHRYIESMAAGLISDEARPLADFTAPQGEYGSHCGLGDPGFQSWTCKEGFHCVALDDPEMGICLPKERRGAGDPCELGTMRSHEIGYHDRILHLRQEPCADAAVCNGNSVGFPYGMCTPSCDILEQGEACGAIVSLHPFNVCIGQRRSFRDCVVENAQPAGMRACDQMHPCRDDYVCARTPNDQGGVCMPPYFLFQLRVDGHVL